MAQDKWSAELRPNINFATQDIGNADLKTGFGFEAAVGYRFMPHLGAYVGWGWNKFASDTPSFPGTGNTDFEMTGYTFGLQFIHPINNSSLSYLIRAGGIYNHIEVENDAGDITADSDHGLGWEIGAGLQVDLGSNWNLRPQIGYRALSRDIEIGNTTTDVDLNYISFGVGIAKIF
ncbi:Opacity protein [Flagellimonas lutaonensis]|uniref:Opacity protein n=2 Tax=Flagellimonas lutaonensis TaxID=516051 RepID=A0A0D5YR06_9FLAO|nr:Opacity protein [Allomuricauda lutaonensis]